MSKATVNPSAMTPRDRRLEPDLTAIRGIGVTKRQWLEAVGICTVQDLAQLTADTLKAQLKAQGYAVARSDIERWIIQAQAWMDAPDLAESPAAIAEDVDRSVPPETPSLPAAEPGSVPSPAPMSAPTVEWLPTASFAVEFQSCYGTAGTEYQAIVRSLTTGRTEIWQGYELGQLQPWLWQQLGLNGPIASAVERQTPSVPPLPVEVTQLRIVQPGQTAQPLIADQAEPVFTGTLLADQPFWVEVTVDIPVTAIAELSTLLYRVGCQARHLASGTVCQLGEMQLSQPFSGGSTCVLVLPEARLQQPGAYRLQVAATIDNLPATTGYFKVPVLEVLSAAPAHYAVDAIALSCEL